MRVEPPQRDWCAYEKREGDQNSLCLQTKHRSWDTYPEDGCYNPEEGPHWKKNLRAPWSWITQLPELWERNVCCLSHPVYGILLTAGQARQVWSVQWISAPYHLRHPSPLEISQLRLQTSCSRDKSYLLPCQSCWLKILEQSGLPWWVRGKESACQHRTQLGN